MQNTEEPFHLQTRSDESGEVASTLCIGAGPMKNLIVGGCLSSVLN